jgi:hypothetical protein
MPNAWPRHRDGGCIATSIRGSRMASGGEAGSIEIISEVILQPARWLVARPHDALKAVTAEL